MSEARTPRISRDELLELVRSAVLAPSGHNAQPWRFTLGPDRIEIRADPGRRLPVVDPDDHALFISLGAALENLRIAGLQHGLAADIDYFGVDAPDAIAVTLTRQVQSGGAPLYLAIPERQSTRSRYDGRPIPTADLHILEQASVQKGIRFQLLTGRAEIDAVTELVKEGNRRQLSDPQFVQELTDWIRFSRSETRDRQDGLIAPAMGMPYSPRWLGSAIMKGVLRPGLQARQVESLIRGSSGLMLFIAEHDDREHWVRLGQSFERVALTATTRGIRHAHMNMPCEVVEVRRQLQNHLELGEEQPLLLLRFGYGKVMPRSPRRPLENVLLE
jgi:hypothetical protein